MILYNIGPHLHPHGSESSLGLALLVLALITVLTVLVFRHK
jgi:hypothetical protein